MTEGGVPPSVPAVGGGAERESPIGAGQDVAFSSELNPTDIAKAFR